MSYNKEEICDKYGLDKETLELAMNNLKNKKTYLFAMSGKMGAGKDAVGDALSHELSRLNYNVENLAFGTLIREEITLAQKEYFKKTGKGKCDSNQASVLTAEKLEASADGVAKVISIINTKSVFERSDEAREALQFWGDLRRSEDSNYWVNKMARVVTEKLSQGTSVNITDIRFPAEVDIVEDLSGKVIRLEVKEEIRVERMKQRDGIKVNERALHHISETILDDYKFKRTFDNNERSLVSIFGETLKYLLK